MEIKKIISDNVTTLKLDGWLDTQSAPQLGEAVRELDSTGSLVFDFDSLEYISSGGLREVIAANKFMGGKFSVINVSDEIMDIFSMTGFDKKLDIRRKETA